VCVRVHPPQERPVPRGLGGELSDVHDPAERVDPCSDKIRLLSIPIATSHAGLPLPADLRWWLAEDKQASGSKPAFYEVTSADPVAAGRTARSKVGGTGDKRFGVTFGRLRTLSPSA
jgi:hypothetical protein